MEVKDFTRQLDDRGQGSADFKATDRDETDLGPNFYGFLTDQSTWMIVYEVITANVTATRYLVGKSGYQAAWTARATDAGTKYVYYDVVKAGL